MSTAYLPDAILGIAAFVASCAGVRMLIGYLTRKAILDHPVHRSSHSTPTPRGGGLAVSASVIVAWAVIQFLTPVAGTVFLIGAALLLVLVSWRDDVHSLSAGLRLGIQSVAVAVGLVWLTGQGLVFQGFLPHWADLFVSALLWLGFLNFFNFMDGIDGISAVEAGAIALGLSLIAYLRLDTGLSADDGPYALVILAAAAGFAVWNWHPARIFLGDVGSIPIGFLLGALLLGLAARGAWAPALILPLYYLTDAGITLSRRALRGEAVWRAHKEHFYQRAVQRGFSHAQVSTAILVANTILVALAFFATSYPVPCLVGAIVTTALLLLWMVKWPVVSS
ncbi:MraY family glycosyltransferase [Hwanghaeella sp.]|uniref:MraY family glycosyltransferase n=1 Tax=Hwanghaeella sp. TaxID=2605943 RepID=UPI003CCC225D